MVITHYYSSHVSQEMACWLDVELHRIDTHAYFSATLKWKNDRDGIINSQSFFREWLCDATVLFDWIKRGVVGEVIQAPRNGNDFFIPNVMDELEKTIGASRVLISIPLSDEAESYDQKYRQPNSDLWYEMVVDQFTYKVVDFSISLWGYKYNLDGLTAPTDVFYMIGDRLNARIRFLSQWSSIDDSIRKVLINIRDSITLGRIRNELKQGLIIRNSLNEDGLDDRLRSLFPLIERMLRADADSRGWSTHGLRLDGIIRKLVSAKLLSDDTRQMTDILIKPFRDVVLHGHNLALPVARTILVVLLDCFTRIAKDLDQNQYSKKENAKS